MKRFNLQIECDNVDDLHTALLHAADCIAAEPDRYENMSVDESDEMLDEPATIFYRSE